MTILSTGTSGLLAFQRALATTGHNISNATKDGYSRQRVELEARNPQFLGGSFVGQGVQVSTVRRIQNEFIDTQLRSSISNAANGEARAEYAERIDRLLSDDDTGLAPALGDFFDAASDVASDPTSTTARSVMIAEAESMTGRFHELNTRIEEQRGLLNDQLKVNVSEINELAQSIVSMNKQIIAGYGASGGTGGAPNDLLDERGRLLAELAEKIEITTLEQDDRSVNVFIGNGQGLVLGGTASTLVAEPLSGDPRNYDIGFASASGGEPVNITRFMSGGEIGGLLETRGAILDEAQNGIGRIAVVMSSLMNQQNGLGLDQEGNLGTDMFEVPEVYVGAYSTNAATTAPSVELIPEQISDVTASDYRLRLDGATSEYQLLRLDDNQIVANGAAGSIFEVDGLRIDTSTIVGANADDRWTIQPTRFAAERLDIEISDPAKIAAGAGATLGADNSNSARMMDLRNTNPGDPNTEVPAAVVYDAAGSEYQVFSPAYGGNAGTATIEGFKITDAGTASAANVSYDSASGAFQVGGSTIPLDPTGTTTIASNGWELKIRGTPADGDTFDVGLSTTALNNNPIPTEPTTVNGSGWELDIYGTPEDGDIFNVELSKGRPGDNRNMLAMAGLAEDRVIGNSATFADSYNETLGDVGTRTRQAQVFRDSSLALQEEAQAQRDSLSGVNLDEEAANLLKYQQAYQAAAQVIAVGNSVFDTLFAALRG